MEGERILSQGIEYFDPRTPDDLQFSHEPEIGGSDFTKMVFAMIIMTETAEHAIVCPGVKLAYKRTQVAV